MLVGAILLPAGAPAVVDSDTTLSFDAEPAYSEVQSVQVGYGCPYTGVPNHPESDVFVRDATRVRHGTYSAKMVITPGDYAPGIDPPCARESIRAYGSYFDVAEGDESWWGWSQYFPSTYQATNNWVAGVGWFPYPAIMWPTYGMIHFRAPGLSDGLYVEGNFGKHSMAGDPIVPPNGNGVHVIAKLLGPGAPRPFTADKWHDFYVHVVWRARTNGIWEIWHREDGGSWAKIYSNRNDGSALINRAPHPTYVWNDVNGAIGEPVGSGIHPFMGMYREANALTQNVWIDGFRRRQSEESILAEFPSSESPTVPPTNVSRPVLSGSAAVGKALTTSTGAWSGTAPLTYTYQWRRCDSTGSNCSDLAGATGQSYQLASADVGSKQYALVTATNASGSASMPTYLSATVTKRGSPKRQGTRHVG